RWGIAYASSPPLDNPWLNGLRRTFDWLGFHALLAIGAVSFCWKKRAETPRWLLVWCGISLAGVAAGSQFWPRYFLQLLPPLTLVAARGFALFFDDGSWRRSRLAWSLALVALAVPLVRFGSRYVALAGDLIAQRAHHWNDIVLDQD